MARKHRFVSKPAGLREATAVEPRDLSRVEFGRRLNQILLDRDWSQSDLARQAFGEITDGRGYKVAKNREIVSAIIAGKTTPSPLTLNKIARALGMKAEELYPNARQLAIAEEKEPELEFKVAAGHPDKGWLRVNRLVSYDAFVQIASILQQDQKTLEQQNAPTRSQTK